MRPTLYSLSNTRQKVTDLYFSQSRKESLKFLSRNQKILNNRTIVEFINCPVCNSSKNIEKFIKWGFIVTECQRCTHIYVKNQLKNKILKKLYNDSIVDSLQIKRRSKDKKLYIYWEKLYLKYIDFYLKKKNTVLDVGCGNGQFLDCVKKRKIPNYFGTEFSKNTKEFLTKKFGKRFLYNASIKDISKKKLKFDFVFYWGVLEHLKDPSNEMKNLKKILKPKGRVLILVPNFHSRAMKILGLATPTINPRSHLQFFTYESMNYLCNKNNFSLESIHQELPIIDLIKPYLKDCLKTVNDIIKKNESYYNVYFIRLKK